MALGKAPVSCAGRVLGEAAREESEQRFLHPIRSVRLFLCGGGARTCAMSTQLDNDTRTPSPPFGYSRECDLSPARQVEVVAQFHANRIKPNRIAYRTGIDIATVEALIAGEQEPERFEFYLARHRRARYQQRMEESTRERGVSRFELQQRIESEYRQEPR